MTRRTIAREVQCDGVALHAGTRVRMSLSPGVPGAGVVFRRSDLGGREITAFYAMVAETRLGTVINDGNVSVGVIEHLMAAVAGLAIDDLIVTLDGPEPPILAGDAASYVALFDHAGLAEISGSRRALKIKKRVTAESGDAYAMLEPAESQSFDFDISFASPAIGTQTFSWAYSTDGFRRDIAPARTFGFVSELDALHKMGLGKGASLENTLAIEDDRVLNAHLMRFPDEFVRHKILDALGDLALAGAPIIARFEGHRSGHALNNQLLRAVFIDSANYEWRDAA